MLHTLTIGSSIKKLSKFFNIRGEMISVHRLKKKNILIMPISSPLFDSLNIVGTTKPIWRAKSIYLYKYLVSSLIVVWARIIFRGKGFRIRNFQDDLKLTFNFGHSHWTKIKLYRQWFFWKIKRQSYVILSYNSKYMEMFKLFFPNIKLLNRYTKRGLRLKRQPIVKRFGKISQYISSLH